MWSSWLAARKIKGKIVRRDPCVGDKGKGREGRIKEGGEREGAMISRYKLRGYHMTDEVEYNTATIIFILQKCGLHGWLLGKSRVRL